MGAAARRKDVSAALLSDTSVYVGPSLRGKRCLFLRRGTERHAVLAPDTALLRVRSTAINGWDFFPPEKVHRTGQRCIRCKPGQGTIWVLACV